MPVLIYETGPRKGQTIRLEEGGVYVLGRDPRAQVPIDDELASRQHAKLRGKDGRYFVKDAKSSNGTLVNDARVDLAELSSGDKVTVGTTILTFLSDQEAGGDGRTLGGYKLLQRLGRGGMGTVFRALQLSLNREVALKILSPELSQDPSFQDRFLKEARAAGQLNHPNIVQVYDVDREGGLVFYAMEFVPGGTVEDRLNKEGALPVDEALRLLLDAAKGLQYAELKKIVHRDIKPDNLMLTDIGTVKIADLGLALGTHEGEGKKGAILGTPHFISPEQARNEPLDTRSDLYSLGATFFRMLTGRTMFHGENAKEIIRKQVKDEPPSLRAERSEVPEKVSAIYRKLVQKDPADRFQSPTELIESIELVVSGGGAKRGLVTALVVLVAIAVGAAVWLGRDGPRETIKIVEKGDDGLSQQLTEELEEQQARLREQERETNAMTARVELDERSESLARDEYVAALRAIAEEYAGTTAAGKATAKADEIQAALDEERRLLAEHVAKVERAIAAMESAVDEALKKDDFAAAAAAVAAAGDADEATRSDDSVAATRSRLGQQVLDAADARVRAAFGEAEAALATQAFDDALAAVAKAEALVGDPAAAGDEALGALLTGLAAEATELRGGIRRTRIETRRAELSGDLAAVGERFPWGETFDAIRRHDFAGARASLETLRGTLSTETYRAWLDRRLEDVRAAADLRSALDAALAADSLAAREVRHPARNRSMMATLAGVSPEGDGVLLQVKRGAGTSTSVVAYEEFSDLDAFLDLYDLRFGEAPEERLRVARAALLFTVATARGAVRLVADQIARYDAAAGWTPAQRVALESVTLPRFDGERLAALLEAVAAAPETADAGTRLRARAEREQAAVELLQRALEPFRSPSPTIHFARAADLLDRLASDYLDTDLFLVAYGLLDGEGGTLPLAE